MEIEIAKLIVSFLTPLTIALVGYFIQRTLSEQTRQQKLQERLVDKRLEIYESIGEDLNRIYCYVMDVGTFKAETPDKIISAKRNVDRFMHIYQAIWSQETFNCFKEYMNSAFAHSEGGAGGDAKIRAVTFEKEQALKKQKEVWKPEWNELFTGERDPEHNKKYQLFMNLISKDLGFVDSVSGTGSQP